jgi:hypothetical protein
VPVVPLQFGEENGAPGARHGATGLLRPVGTVLTCSHAVPGGGSDGKIRITGPWIDYRITGRGDEPGGLSGTWTDADPPISLDDWAVIAPEPAIDASGIFVPLLRVGVSSEPPRLGETVYLVGYTVEEVEGDPNGWFVRYWVPLVVVAPPRSVSESLGGSVVWLQAGSQPFTETPGARSPGAGRPSNALKPGFSGAPVLRLRRGEGGAELEVCAVFHGVTRGRDDIGVAIVPRLFGEQRGR